MLCKHLLVFYLFLFHFKWNAATASRNGVKSENLPVPGDPFATEVSDEQIEEYEKMLQNQKAKHRQQIEEYEKMLQQKEGKHDQIFKEFENTLQKQEEKHRQQIEKYEKMLEEQEKKHRQQSEEYEKMLQKHEEKHKKLIDSHNSEMNTFLQTIVKQFISNLGINLNSAENIYQNTIINLTNAEVKILKTFMTSSDSSSSSTSSRQNIQKILAKFISKAPTKTSETKYLCISQSSNIWIAIFVILFTFLIFNRPFISRFFGKLLSRDQQKPILKPIPQKAEDANVEEVNDETLPTPPPPLESLPLPALQTIPPPPPPPPSGPLLPSRNPPPARGPAAEVQNTPVTFDAELATAIGIRRKKLSEGSNKNESDDDDDSIVVIQQQEELENDESWSQ